MKQSQNSIGKIFDLEGNASENLEKHCPTHAISFILALNFRCHCPKTIYFCLIYSTDGTQVKLW